MVHKLYKPRISKESIDKLWSVRGSMIEERQPRIDIWRGISLHTNPSMSDWEDTPPNSQTNKKDKRKEIYDNEGYKCSNRFADCMQSYSFGRNLDWQHRVTEDPKLMEQRDAVEWLQDSNIRVNDLQARSRFYDEGRSFVKCWADFATSIMVREFDEAHMTFAYKTLHLKHCLIAENHYGDVDTLFRDLWLTPMDAINSFGRDSLPQTVLDAAKQTGIRYFKFVQFILPIDKYDLDLDARSTRGKDYYSLYMSYNAKESPIREGGYSTRPFYVARWARSLDGSVWGDDSPGIIEYSTMRQLNAESRDFDRGAQLGFQPPIKATEGLRGEGVHLTPNYQHYLHAGNDFTTVPVTGPFEPVMKRMMDLKASIKTSYYEDLWATFSHYLERVKSATEAAAIKGEVAAQIAALSGRLQYEFLEPASEDAFQTAYEYRLLKKVPDSLNGKSIRTDLVSPMMQLQKRYLMLNETDEYVGRMLQAANAAQDFSILDHIDWEGYAQVLRDSYNIDIRLARELADVQRLRAARAQAQAQSQMQQLSMERAKTQAAVLAAGSKAPEPGSPTAAIMRTG